MTLNARKSTITYYWCQTVELIVLSVVVKSSKIDNVKVHFGETFLDIKLKSAPTTTYRLQLGLSNPIIPCQSSYTVLSAKLEVRLKKCKPVFWTSFEGEIKTNHTYKRSQNPH